MRPPSAATPSTLFSVLGGKTDPLPAAGSWNALQLVGRPCDVGRAEWDAFAQRSGASFRGAYRAAAGWRYDHHTWSSIRRGEVLELQPSGPVRVAQFALSMRRGEGAFLDTLQVAPEHQHRWPAILGAALKSLGPGLYHYGSDWDPGPARDAVVATLRNVELREVSPTSLDLIEFERWASWADYLASVSTNVIRNERKASRIHGDLEIELRTGPFALLNSPALSTMRIRMYRDKDVPKSPVGMALRSIARTWCMRDHAAAATISAGSTTLSAYAGIDFGEATYYLEGASARDNGGAGWRLLLAMIRRAYERTGGRGVFVMGPTVAAEGVSAGLARSRAQVRATPRPGARFTFAYRG